MQKRQKETVLFDPEFLKQWHDFCAARGYVRRRAAHACRLAFMKLLTAEQREEVMEHAVHSERGAGGATGARAAARPSRSKRVARGR